MDDTASPSRRQASVIAGAGLLILAILGAFANFGVLESLVTDGNAAQTSDDILASATLFRIGVASLVLVATLDIVVAWALLVVFRSVNGRLSQLTAWFRIIYAGVFAAGISMLPGVLRLLDTSDGLAAIPMDQRQAQALLRIDTFNDIWNTGLVLFGVHLLLLGYLTYQSGVVPKILAVLIAIAGAGYVIDSFGSLLSASYTLELSTFTFIGEALLIIWLLVAGRRLPDKDK